MKASTRFNNDLRYRDESDPRQVHLTPDYILDPIRSDLGGIGLDPCTEPDNPTNATFFYAPPEDGAALPWLTPTIFVNPPYGKARERWVRRCIQAGSEGRSVVLLMPAATDTRVFQMAAETARSIVFIRGRVKFGVLRPNRRQAAASHPSAVFGWNVSLDQTARLGVRIVPMGRLGLRHRIRAALGDPTPVPCFFPDPDSYPEGSEPPEGFDEWRPASGLCTHDHCIEGNRIGRLFARTPRMSPDELEEMRSDHELMRDEFHGRGWDNA